MLEHDHIRELFHKIATKLGASDGFIEKLNRDDDWNFVIKICIFTEELCGDALIRCIGKPEMANYINKLPFVGGATGKLSLLIELDLIDSDTKRYISTIANIRNRYAHRIRYSNLNIPDYLALLSIEDFNSIKTGMGRGKVIVDTAWKGQDINSSYWRIIIESCFILSAIDLTKRSGLMKETVEELRVESKAFLELFPRV